MNIDRWNFVKSLRNAIEEKGAKAFKKDLHVVFQDEQGSDGGGLKREFFDLVGKELADEANNLMIPKPNSHQFKANHKGITEEHFQHMICFGVIFACGLLHKMMFPIEFSESFYKHFLDIPLTFHHDIKNEAPQVHSSISATNFDFSITSRQPTVLQHGWH